MKTETMPAHKPLILCVDDDQIMRIMLSRILVQAGYEVISLNNGKEAIKFVRNITPDLILLDAMMPDMDGYSIALELQQNKKTAYIPVIFATALVAENNFKVFSAGAVDYINKPFVKEALLSKVKTHLNTSLRWQHIYQDINYHEDLSTSDLQISRKISFVDNAKSDLNFDQFKQYLAQAYLLSDTTIALLATIKPENIYDFCAAQGITSQSLAFSIALFLKLPYIAKIDVNNMRVGVLPLSFCRSKQVLVTKDAANNNLYVVSNPFDREMIDILQNNIGHFGHFVIAEPKTIIKFCTYSNT